MIAPLSARPVFLAERQKWFHLLRAQPEPGRAWWMHLSQDRRRAVLAAENPDWARYVARTWDELPEACRAALRAAHHKRASLFARLRDEFLPIGRAA